VVGHEAQLGDLIVRRWLGIGVSIAISLMLAACARGTVQDALGIGKRSPDEFAVVSRAPLILPPDYGLRPPAPGESRPGVDTANERARATLTGRELQQPAGPGQEVAPAVFAEPGAAVSSGERALMTQATTTPVDPDIRRKIAEENMQLAQVEQELFTRLVKWREPSTLEVAIDPAAETERLRANRAEGKPPTEGESPVITKRRQSVLQGFLSEVF
jgi:Protein of unknown function (DUF3035)